MEPLSQRKLPNHPATPSENIFIGRDFRLAERIVSHLQDYLYANVRAAQTFISRPGDIILVSGPCSGEEALGKVLAALVCEDIEFLANYSPAWTLPWIESRYAAQQPEDLLNSIFTKDVRVLRTQMGLTMLNPRQRKGPKFVVLLRSPVDLRACYFKQLRACYTMKGDGIPLSDFDTLFESADDFLNVPIPLCQFGTALTASSYEQFVAEWYRESRSNSDVFVIFHEELLSNPVRTITKLNAFLRGAAEVIPAWKKKPHEPAFIPREVPLAEDALKRILDVARLSKGGLARDNRKSTTFRRLSVAVQSRTRSMSKRLTLSGGIGVRNGDGGEGTGGLAFEKSSSLRTIQTFWELGVGLNPPSYEKLYEADVGEVYPFPQVSTSKAADASASTVQEKFARVLIFTKARLTNIFKTSDIERPPNSANRQPQSQHGFTAEDGNDIDELRRKYAGSMLPAQAFATGEWTTTTSLVRNFEQQTPDDDAVMERALCDHDDDSMDKSRYKTSQLSDSVSSHSVASKFVSQDVMEANMLRSSMRQAGVDKAIVDVVAVKPEQLSEML